MEVADKVSTARALKPSESAERTFECDSRIDLTLARVQDSPRNVPIISLPVHPLHRFGWVLRDFWSTAIGIGTWFANPCGVHLKARFNTLSTLFFSACKRATFHWTPIIVWYSLINFTFLDDFGCFARTFVGCFWAARPPTKSRISLVARFSRELSANCRKSGGDE